MLRGKQTTTKKPKQQPQQADWKQRRYTQFESKQNKINLLKNLQTAMRSQEELNS